MPPPSRLRAVIFDLDGVLLDSERPVRDVALAAARDLGRPLDEATYATLIGQPITAVRALLLQHFAEPALLEAFWVKFRAAIGGSRSGGPRPMPGVAEILDAADAARLRLAVCTSTERARALAHLARIGIDGRFSALVGGDEVARGKPHPEPYLLAAERLEVAPAECLVLEDSHNGVRSAHAAGMRVVMVPDLLPATPEIAALCHAVVPDLRAAIALLGGPPSP